MSADGKNYRAGCSATARAAIKKFVKAAGKQGWMDLQMILGVVLLNLACGDCMEDIERLEYDAGFAALLRSIEKELLTRKERRAMKARWRRGRECVVPSPSLLSDWLERFHEPDLPEAVAGTAFIPEVTKELRGLWLVNQTLLAFVRKQTVTATLDMDATLIETHKSNALSCYKKFKAYQPLNVWWAELAMMLNSEFRDGNVPAGHEQLRVLIASRALLPADVTRVFLRSDTAGYQSELLLYCGEGNNSSIIGLMFWVASTKPARMNSACFVGRGGKKACWGRNFGVNMSGPAHCK